MGLERCLHRQESLWSKHDDLSLTPEHSCKWIGVETLAGAGLMAGERRLWSLLGASSSTRFSDKYCPQEERWRMTEQDTHDIVLWTPQMHGPIHSHTYMDRCHTWFFKWWPANTQFYFIVFFFEAAVVLRWVSLTHAHHKETVSLAEGLSLLNSSDCDGFWGCEGQLL